MFTYFTFYRIKMASNTQNKTNKRIERANDKRSKEEVIVKRLSLQRLEL